MGSPTEAQTRLVESHLSHPAHRLFATPRIDVDALCRLALLRYLEGCDPELSRTTAASFDSYQAAGQCPTAGDAGVWSRLKQTLERTRVVDPACGEADMLVGMLELLDGLLSRADRVLGIYTDPGTRRISIVQHNLYGVEAQASTLSRARQRLARAIVGSGQDLPLAVTSNLAWGDSVVERDDFRWSERFRSVMEAGGFHLVLGNPPYVRHEQIADPLNTLSADRYKREVFAVAQAKQHGLLDASRSAACTTLSHRSDLCVLFTLFGLSLLTPDGVLGFVVPTALLSAQYGEPFWHTLISAGFDHRIVENYSRRSFAQAAVNTALLLVWRLPEKTVISASRPADASSSPAARALGRPSRSSGNRTTVPAGLNRVQNSITARCTALDALGRLRYPIKTGLNCFYYPDIATRSRFNIELRYLVPVVKSPRDIDTLTVTRADLSSVLFHCVHSPAELRRDGASGALSYVAWGAEQTRIGCDAVTRMPWPTVPSVRGRNPWYSISLPAAAHILCPRFLHRRFFFALPEPGIVEDQTFYGLTLWPGPRSNRKLIGALLNSSLSYLMMEIHGRTGLGDGVRQYALRDMASLPVLDPTAVDTSHMSALTDVFEQLACRPILPIEEDVQCPDRIELDALVCTAIGLSASVGAAARQYLTALVEQRLARATRRY